MNKISKFLFLSLGFAHEKHFFFLLKFFICFHRWEKKTEKKIFRKKNGKIFLSENLFQKNLFSPGFTHFHLQSSVKEKKKFSWGKKNFSQKNFFIHIFNPFFLDLSRELEILSWQMFYYTRPPLKKFPWKTKISQMEKKLSLCF